MREFRRKLNGGVPKKTTHISAATYHKLQTVVPNQSLANVLFMYFQEYANEIIFIKHHWMNELVNLQH